MIRLAPRALATSGGVPLVGLPGGWATSAGALAIAGGDAFGTSDGEPTFGGAGGGPPPVVTETLTVTLPPASWTTTMRSGRDGWIGSTYQGAYVAIPGRNAVPARYVWWNAGQGTDPADWDASLAGYTGVEVTLSSGVNITAANVATATRSALGSLYTIGGTGAVVTIEGEIDSVASFTGASATSASADRGQFGCRAQYNTSDNTLVGVVSSFGQIGADDIRVSGMRIYLTVGDPAAGEQVSLAIYTGGSSDGSSLVGTTLIASGVTTNAATGWNTVVFDEPVVMSASVYYRVCAKAETSTTRNGYISLGVPDGIDFDPSVPLQIYDVVDPDITVPWPSTLAGNSISTAGVFAMLALVYETAPYRSDGSWTQTLGVHADSVLGASQSPLTSPDPLGANVMVAMQLPPVLGMEYVSWSVGIGSVHTDQFRGGIAQGGVFEDPDGAVVVFDGGLTTGVATNSWISLLAPGPGGSAISATASAWAWWWLRGNGGITVRFADNANLTVASPTENPSDLAISSGLGSGSEYETNSSNPALSTNPAVAFESPIVTSGGDYLPGNYPACRISMRVNPITLVAS